MHILAERYGQLGEEARLSSITDLMNFNRVGNERVDDLITRFEIIRQRARDQGTLTMSIEGLAWILLKSCQINDTQLLNLLQPFGGRFPTTEQELRDLYGALRRMGHIMERRPNNIAQQLRSPQSGNLRAFMVTDGGWGQPDSNQTSTGDGGWDPPQSSNGEWNPPSSSSWDQSSWMAAPVSNQGDYSYVGWTPQTMDYDSGTDTDTVSSEGQTAYTYADIPRDLEPNQTAEHLFWAYQQAKGRYRKFMVNQSAV